MASGVYWFDVEQGDGQLVVGPTGRTLLVDLGETAWNSTTNSKAKKIAQKIREICGISSGPVHLDYVMASHHHLDHIGYAGNPNDTGDIDNGIYELLKPATEGGLGFTVGTLFDRDAGVWTDANGDGDCDVGTASSQRRRWSGTTPERRRRLRGAGSAGCTGRLRSLTGQHRGQGAPAHEHRNVAGT